MISKHLENLKERKNGAVTFLLVSCNIQNYKEE
jgi:hypothetical protein